MQNLDTNYDGGCQLSYTELEQNSLCEDFCDICLGIPKFYWGIPENCGKFRKFWGEQLSNQFSLLTTNPATNCVTTDQGTTSYICPM